MMSARRKSADRAVSGREPFRLAIACAAVLCTGAALLFLFGTPGRQDEQSSPAAGSEQSHGSDSERLLDVRGRAALPNTPRLGVQELVSEDARHGVRVVVHEAANVVREALEDARRFPQLTSCRRAGHDCTAPLLAALEVALDYPVRPGIGEGSFGISELEARVGPRQLAFALHENASDVLQQSSDPVERVVALALLERAEVPLPPLPPLATARLGDLPPIEQRLVLGELSNSPSTDRSTLEAVERLAQTGDTSTRTSAIQALGASHSAEALGRVLAGAAQTLPQSAARQVTPALVICGSACGPVMLSLLEQRVPGMQLAALSAIASLDPSSRQELSREALRLVSRTDAPPSIRQQLDYLRGFAGS